MALFTSCPQCGKKMFSFPWSNNAEVCNSCESANRIAKETQEANQRKVAIAETKKFYDELVRLWDNTGNKWYYSFASLDEAHAVNSDCDVFQSLVQQIPEYPYFNEVFADNCDYVNADSCSSKDFGRLDVSHIDANTVKLDFDQLIKNVNRRQERAQKIIQNSQSFQEMLDEIQHVEIQYECIHQLLEKPDIGFFESKNITSRTSIDKLNPFYVVDVETTGLNPTRDEILQIAAIRFVNFEPVDAFVSYTKPHNGLNPRAQAINGITENDVENAPYIESIVNSLSTFLSPDPSAKRLSPIVGHNLSFDVQFLRANGVFWLYSSVRNFYDTLELSKREFKEHKSYKLDFLVNDILHIYRTNTHDALSDALATGLLFKEICRRRIGF